MSTPMMQQISALKREAGDAILLTRMGDFYELLGEDARGFLADLQRRVAIPTTSQEQGSMPALQEYVSGEMSGSLKKLGYECTVLPNPRAEYGPFLIARRVEDPAKPTVLTYGHGDVIRGQDDQWRQGLSPWKIVIEGEKMYGRGTADNKGQHTINIAALQCVLEERGSLGFNSTILIETGEAERTVTLKVDRWWTGGDETELVVAASMSVAS